VFLKGLTFTDLLPQTGALLVYGLVVFAIALRKFKKTIS
jgi:hypothetical protein